MSKIRREVENSPRFQVDHKKWFDFFEKHTEYIKFGKYTITYHQIFDENFLFNHTICQNKI